jgi:hypothetical protein
MISVHIKAGQRPRVLAVFSFRFDAHLVPALLANIEPLSDGWIAFDDTGGRGVFTDEISRRAALLTAAREAGARWVLAVDPDERFERGFAEKIESLTAAGDRARVYEFRLREMYSPDQYRVDGLWGRKRQARLLSLVNGIAAPAAGLHRSWAAFIPGRQVCDTDFNLYHLKMMTRERRRARAALYKHLDPDGCMQRIGYDYLADDNGVELERIPEGREYHPPHHEDGGLWMPDLPAAATSAVSF